MELGFMTGVVVLLMLYIFRKPIKQKSEDIELDMKANSAETGIETAKRLIEVNKEVEALGDIPNVDDMLDILHGKKPNIKTNSEE